MTFDGRETVRSILDDNGSLSVQLGERDEVGAHGCVCLCWHRVHNYILYVRI